MVAKKSNSEKASTPAGASACADKNCPVHGTVKTRGRTFVGTVISDRMSKTVVVSWGRRSFVKKYERYERKWSKINAHNPECITAKKGDIVEIQETRPLSKTKHFVITKILGRETKKEHVKIESIEEEEAREELARKREDKDKEEQSE